MREASAAVQDALLAMAAVLTAVRSRLVELSASLPEEEPATEGQDSGPGLRSVVACILTDSIEPAIRDLLAASEPEIPPRAASQPPPEAEELGYHGLWARLDVRLPRLLAEGERERREAERLFRDLVSFNPAERLAALEDARFHRPVVVDRLLEGAQGALPSDPSLAEQLATLANAVADRLADADETMGGRARAACWIAHARRIGGDPAGAEQALAEATLYAAYSDEQAQLCRALALLRWEQGRLDEAAALLEHAAELWAGEELVHELGACQVLRALLKVEVGKARDAVGMLQDGLPLLVDPWLTVYGGLALALGLAERGQAKRARQQRAESERLVPLVPAAAYLFARHLEAKVALSLGEHDAAQGLLEEVRREALERRWLPEAAVATLDLARLDVERGTDRETAKKRASELEAAFTGAEGLDGLMCALRGFPDQLPVGESLPELTAALEATCLRLLRLRGVRSAPLPFV